MPSVNCPVPGCNYATPDTEAVIVAALITAHANSTHNGPAQAGQGTTKVEKVKRPTIVSSSTSEDWTYFLTRWNEYKQATRVAGREIIILLLECCEEQLRKDLTRSSVGPLTEKTEDDILAAIKSLAVREENIMVARVALNNMHQDQDESIRAFGARLRGQAAVCRYVIDCPGDECNIVVDYTEQILRDVLCRGIVDPDIQLELLGHTNQDMTLEEVFHFVEAKEAGKRSANRLLDNQAAAIRSNYSKSKRDTLKQSSQTDKTDKVDKNSKCSYCGTFGHGTNSTSQSRRNSCPAKSDNASIQEESNSVFNALCAVSSNASTESPIAHHCYDPSTNTWKKRSSKSQPFIPLSIQVAEEDYLQLGFKPIAFESKPIQVRAMADTGCQSCLISFKHIQRLGLNKKDLLPTTMKLNSANNQSIKVLGAIILKMSGKREDGTIKETKQFVYVTNESDKFFLSRGACIDLGIISETFPTIGESLSLADINIPQDIVSECGCPRRALPPPLPTELPFPATDEHRHKLENFLLEYYGNSTFNTCEHQSLPLMEAPPMKLMIDPEAEPVAHHSPIPVPINWQDTVKANLDRDVRLGVIEPVPIGEPVTWCHRMVVCAKKNGNPRRTVDFQLLNKHASRETHHTQSPYHQVRSVPTNKRKTASDAWNGYHSVPLREEDRHLTTFITPWGRYRYKTLPQGYIASGDGYSRRFDEIVSDFPDKIKVIDDALLWSEDLEASFYHHSCKWLDICGKNGIIQNPSKFKFGENIVEFAGFEITLDSVRPAPSMLRAITDFPTPKNITDVRSWFGLINQVSYAFSMTETMLPFRELLKPKTPFCWTDELQHAFEQSKLHIVSEIEKGVKIFDKGLPTCLATDWSKTGVGFLLYQKHCSCKSIKPQCCKDGWQVVLVGSRFTSPAESRYAPVEGEALAVAYSLDRARHFVLGCKELIIAVDHKPLLGLFTNRSLDDIPNNRLENPKELTLRYRFSMYHIPGLKHRASDATSRYPTGDPLPEPLFLQDDIAPINVSDHTLQSIQSITWDKVRLLSASDPEMKQLIDFIDSNMSASKNEIPASVQPFHQFIDHLSTVDGVALYKDRVIIPKQLRQAVLIALHGAHHGVTSMTARADSSVFWPGISKDIVKQRNNCNHCDRIAPSQPSAPPTPLTYPEYPFQYLCGDFFHHKGHYYLVCVDRYSNWPIVEESKEGATSLINCLRRSFVTYGIPDELSSDGGPEFTASSTETFLKNWGVKHRRSSVAFPHSNCRAEIGVKTVKRMLTDNSGPNGELDTESFQRAMLQYRNTPNQDTKLSSAMCLFGRPIKDFIPIFPGKYLPHSTWQNVLQDRENALRHRHMKIAERLEQHTRRLPPLRVGDRVRLQNQIGPHPKKWDKTGSVVEVRQHDQYVVRVDGSRRVTPRNRKFLRRYVPVHQTPQFVGNDIPVPISPTAQQLLNTPRETTYAPGVSPTPPARLTEQTHPSKNTSPAPSSDGSTSTLDPTPTTNAQAPVLRRSSRIRKPPSYLTDFQT
ncbi:uncharacterized protein [Clytia hemisphaerica]|uniref:uncharacterized protein n=1 Tax=Clytia hemisphaerica TaxID=252671 RepID=UPI0034D5205A